jgi:hypothetical protein
MKSPPRTLTLPTAAGARGRESERSEARGNLLRKRRARRYLVVQGRNPPGAHSRSAFRGTIIGERGGESKFLRSLEIVRGEHVVSCWVVPLQTPCKIAKAYPTFVALYIELPARCRSGPVDSDVVLRYAGWVLPLPTHVSHFIGRGLWPAVPDMSLRSLA